MEMLTTKKLPSRKKIALGLLHQRLVHISTRIFLEEYTASFWEGIKLMIDPYPFFTLCIIYSMNKKARYKNPLNPKHPFLWIEYHQQHPNV